MNESQHANFGTQLSNEATQLRGELVDVRAERERVVAQLVGAVVGATVFVFL